MVFLSCVLSAVLLDLSFPQIEWSFLAWVALVPLFRALEGQTYPRAFALAYLCGFIFFSLTIGWLVYVTYPGAILLIAFLSLYFGLFGLVFVFFGRLPLASRFFIVSSGWVALEYVRAHLLTGFGWVMLGHSQYTNLLWIQIADLTGVYGVSFIIVLVNLVVFETLKALFKKDGRLGQAVIKVQISVIVILSMVLVYGAGRMTEKKSYATVKIGVIQPNVALVDNWDETKKPFIVAHALSLSHQLAGKKPDMIVWPETSLPGTIEEDPLIVDKIRQTAQSLQTPLLIGSVTQEDEHYFNSAYLIDSDGRIQDHYDKIHLVPFGEFLPLRPILGWVNHFVPIDDFTSGKKYTIFEIAGQKKFAVLICFEDTLAYLARNFTNAGAEFFVNMTNDAWFRDTKAPFLHLQTAVFSCVANRRSMVRAANTGVSAWVNDDGRILKYVQELHGKKTFMSSTGIGRIAVNHDKTFYTKYGDVFTWGCFFCIVVAAFRRRYV